MIQQLTSTFGAVTVSAPLAVEMAYAASQMVIGNDGSFYLVVAAPLVLATSSLP